MTVMCLLFVCCVGGWWEYVYSIAMVHGGGGHVVKWLYSCSNLFLFYTYGKSSTRPVPK